MSQITWHFISWIKFNLYLLENTRLKNTHAFKINAELCGLA